MKKRFFKGIVLALFAVTALVLIGSDRLLFTSRKVYAADSFETGSGTKKSPYVIQTEEEFLLFKNSEEFIDSYFVLGGNLVITARLGDGTNGTVNMFNSFRGVFDGKGYTVTYTDKSTVNGSYFGGIVGTLLSTQTVEGPDEYDEYTYSDISGTVKNVNVVADFSVNGNYVGGVVGRVLFNSFESTRRYNTVTIGGESVNTVNFTGNLNVTGSYVGGVIGEYQIPAINLTRYNVVTLNYDGENAIQNISSSVNNSVSGASFVGGAVGNVNLPLINLLNDRTIANIEFNAPSISIQETARVRATADYVGGLIGNYNAINAFDISTTSSKLIQGGKLTFNGSYAEVNSARSIVGGLVGYYGGLELALKENVETVINSTGDYIGGLFGQLSKNSYTKLCDNHVTYKTTIRTNGSMVGGYVSYINAYGMIKNVTATVDIKGFKTIGGLVGNLGDAGQLLPAQIDDITLYGKVEGIEVVGGVVGSAVNQTLDNLYHISDTTSYVDVIGGGHVGGIIGGFNEGTTKKFKINNTWMAGTVDLNTDYSYQTGMIHRNYLYWGSFYGYQSKNYSTDATSVFFDNSGTLHDVKITGSHNKVDVFGMLKNLPENVNINKISEENGTTTYQIKAKQDGSLGVEGAGGIYGFVGNYNGQVFRIEKTDGSYTYVTSLDRTMSIFNTDFDINLDEITSYGEEAKFTISPEKEIEIETAEQLEHLAFVLQYYIPDEGIEVLGVASTIVDITLTKVNGTYDLTKSKGYYGDNNFYGFGYGSFGPFLGNFDGKGNTILLDMNFPDGVSVGFVGALSSNAGGFNATASQNVIYDLNIAGRVHGAIQVGAAVGLHDNYAPAMVFEYDRKSTIVIDGVTNFADVSGKYIVGGILGYTHSSDHRRMYPFTESQPSENYKGEVTYGEVRALIVGCTNYGNVSSTSSMGTGGLVGSTGYQVASSMYIKGCTNVGNVKTTEGVAGGFIGNVTKMLIIEGDNKVYGNVSGKYSVGLVYGSARTELSYKETLADDAPWIPVSYTPDLSAVSAYYYVSLGDMSEKILGSSIQIDGKPFTFGTEHLFKDISSTEERYAYYNLTEWVVKGVNTLENVSIIESYQGEFEKDAQVFITDPTTLGYILDVAKAIEYSEEESTLEKVYNPDKGMYEYDWDLKAIVTYFDNSTKTISVGFDKTGIDEASNRLVFENVSINDPKYILEKDDITLYRITEDIAVYQSNFGKLGSLQGIEQYNQYKLVEQSLNEILTKYQLDSNYLDSYLNKNKISQTYLNKWKSVISMPIVINDNKPLSTTYGTKQDTLKITYKTIDGKTSRTSYIVVAYSYERSGDALVAVAKYSGLLDGSTHYYNELVDGDDSYIGRYEFDDAEILTTITEVYKREVVVSLENQTFIYDGSSKEMVPTLSGTLEEDGISPIVKYNGIELKPTNAGSYDITVSLAGKNTDYYEISYAKATLVIEKAKVEVLYDANSFTYNGEIQKPSLTISHNSSFVGDYYEASIPDSIDAGNYTASVNLTDSQNFEFVTTGTVNYVINKKDADLSLRTKNYIIDTVASSIVPIVDETLQSLTYKVLVKDENGEEVDPNSKLPKGTYTIEFIYKNYKTPEKEINVVDSIDLSGCVVTYTNTGVYTGLAHKVIPTVTLDGETLIFGVDFTVVYDENTNFIDTTQTHYFIIEGMGVYSGKTMSYEYNITKAQIELEVEDKQEFVFGTLEDYLDVVKSNVSGVDFITVYEGINGTEYSGSKTPTNVGEYKVTITSNSSDNYEALSNAVVRTFKIVKAETIITAEDLTVTYNTLGQNITASINHPESSITYRYYNGSYDSNTAPANAGTYNVEIKVAASANYKEATKTVTLTINKQELKFENIIDSFEYDGTLKTVTYGFNLNVDVTSIVVTGIESSINVTTKNYVLTIVDNNYFGQSEERTFKVTAVDPTVPTVEPLTAIYNQKLNALTLPQNFTWKNPTDVVGRVGTNKHTAIYNLNNPNYNTVEVEISVNVGKADPTDPFPSDLTATYGDVLSSIELPTGFSFKADGNTLVGNAGNNEHVLIFTPEDTESYNTIERSVIIKVNKKQLAAPVIEVTPDKNKITLTYYENALYSIDDKPYQTSNVFEGLTPNTPYVFRVYLKGDENHLDSEIVEILGETLDKDEPEVTGIESKYAVDFGQILTLNPTASSNGKISFKHADEASKDIISINGMTFTAQNAGTAKILMVVEETENYSRVERIIEIIVNKIAPSAPTVSIEVPYGTKYGDILEKLSSEYSFDKDMDLEQIFENLGPQPVKVNYQKQPANNYLMISVEITVNVIKANPTVNVYVENDQLLISDKLKNEMLKLSLGDTPGRLIFVDGQKLQLGENYYSWKFIPTNPNYLELTGQIKLTVSEKILTELVITENPLKMTYTAFEKFNPSGMKIEAVYSDGSKNVISVNNISYNTNPLTTSDTSITITYRGISTTLDIVVNKKKLEFKNVQDVFTYDGTLKEVTFELDQDVIVQGSISSTLPTTGTPYTLTIVDDNYEGTYTGNLVVNKGIESYTVPTGLTAKYGQTLSEITLPAGFTWMDSSLVVGNATKNVHLVKYTPTNNELYQVVENIEVTVDVSKINPTVPVIGELTAAYNTLLKDVVIGDVHFAWQNPNEAVGSVGAQKHYATFTPSDTINYNVLRDIEITINVTKAQRPKPIVNIISQTETSVTLTDLPGAKFSLDKVTWQDSREFTNLVEGNEYTAYVYYPESENYLASEVVEITFTLSSKQIPTISGFENIVVTYKPNLSVIFNPSSNSSGEIEYYLGTEVLDKGMLENLTVGEYSITLKQKETTLFAAYQKTISVTVVKANPAYNVPTNLTGTYEELLSSVVLPTGFSFQNVDIDTAIFAASGEQTYYLTYTPTDTLNYEIVRDIEVTINVAKKESVVEVVYDGPTLYTSMTSLPELTLKQSNTQGTLSIIDYDYEISAGENVFAYQFEPANPNYETYIGYITIEIKNPVLEKIELSTTPSDTTYTAFDKFDLSEIKVTATYSDGLVVEDFKNYIVEYQNPSLDYFTASDEYVKLVSGSKEIKIEVTVLKKFVEFINVVDTFDYNGLTQTVLYETTVPNLKVKGNVSSKDVTSVDYTLEVDDENYQGTYGGTFKIEKITYSDIEHTPLNGTYNKDLTLADYQLNAGFKWLDSTITPSVDITTYYAIYNIDPVNYEDYVLEITLKLNKQTVQFSDVCDTYKYNGEIQTVTYKLPVSNLFVRGNVESVNVTNGMNYTLVIEDTNYQGSYSGTLVILKETPVVEVSYEGILYPSSEAPNLVINTSSTEGTASLKAGQKLVVGKNEYIYEFVPTNPNYETVEGIIILEVSKPTPTILSLAGKPYQTEYNAFDKFVSAGSVLNVYYNDGTSRRLNSNEFTYVEYMTVDTAKVIYSYVEDGVTLTYTLALTINKLVPTITPIVDTANKLYTSSSMPSISILGSDTPGEIKFIDSLLKLGTNKYRYEYLPTDEVNYEKVIGEVTLTVYEVKLTELVITKNPTKLVYNAFEEFDKTGIEVTAKYNDGSSKVVTDFKVTGEVLVSSPYVKIEYEGLITQLELTVNKINPTINPFVENNQIFISSKKPTLYIESLDTPGVIDWDNEAIVVGKKQYSYTFIPSDQVNYNSVKGTLELEVLALSISRLELVTNPNKTEYIALEEFISNGLWLRGYYNDGSVIDEILNYTVVYNSGNELHYGDTYVTLSYMGVDVKCDVTVSKASLVGLVEFNDKTVTYNGSAHRLEIEEMPFGVYKEDISYSYNVGLNAGVYNATVVINSNDYYQYKAEATLTVEKRIINVLTEGSNELVYTGSNFVNTMIKPKFENLIEGHLASSILNIVILDSSGNPIAEKELKNVGSYRYQISLLEQYARNYEFEEFEEITFEVTPKHIKLDTLVKEFIYSENSIELENFYIVGEDSNFNELNIVFKQNEEEVLPIKVGLYQVELTSTNPNFVIDNTLQVEIKQRLVDLELESSSSIYLDEVGIEFIIKNLVNSDDVKVLYEVRQNEEPTTLLNAGIYQIVVVGLSGQDSNQYRFEEISFDYVITKLRVNMEFDDESYTYNGLSQTPIFEFTQDGIEYSIEYYNGNTLLETAPVDAGRYTIKVIPLDLDNYEFDMNTLSKEFEIHKKSYEIIYPADLTYNGSLQEFKVLFSGVLDEDLDSFKYLVNDREELFGLNAGTYNIKVIVNNDNYETSNSMEKEVKINVLEVTLNIEMLKEKVTYNKESLGGFKAEEVYQVVSNYEGIVELEYSIHYLSNGAEIDASNVVNAGIYTISLSAENNENVKYKLGNNRQLIINPMTINLYSPNGTGAQIIIDNSDDVFNNAVQGVTYELVGIIEGDIVNVEISYLDNNSMPIEPMNFGTYDAVVSSIDNPNYTLPLTDIKVKYKIVKKVINVVADNKSSIYGEDLISDLTYQVLDEIYADHELKVELYTNANQYVASEEKPYLIKFQSAAIYNSDGSINNNYQVEEHIGDYEVKKRIADISLEQNEFVYTNSNIILNFIQENTVNNDLAYSYYEIYKVTMENNEKVLTKVDEIVNAGSYEIHLTENPNYVFKESNILEVKVSKQVVSPKLSQTSAMYTGNEILIGFITKDALDQTLSNLVVDYNIYLGDEIVDSIKNVGTYKIITTVVDDNYEGTSELEFEVLKANYQNIVHPDIFVTYDEALNLYDLELLEYFRYSAEDVSLNVSMSGRQFDIIYNADPINYNDYLLQVTIYVGKKDVEDFEFNGASFVYDALAHSLEIKSLPLGVIGVEYTNNSLTNVGKKEVTASFIVNENYNFVPEKTALLEVTKRTVTIIPTAGLSKSFSKLDPTITYEISGLPENVKPIATGRLTRALGEVVGSYEYRLGTLSLGNNYKLELQPVDKFTINPLEISNIYLINNSFEYTGSVINLTLKMASGVLPKGITYELITGDALKNVGTYTVKVLSTNNNYVISEEQELLTVEITKKDASDQIKFNYQQATYTGVEITDLVSCELEHTVQILKNNEPSKLLNAGSYTIIVTITDSNYSGTAFRSFKINKASQEISLTLEDLDITPYTISQTKYANLLYGIGNIYKDSLEGLKEDETYQVSFKLAETENYLESNIVTLEVKTLFDYQKVENAIKDIDAVNAQNLEHAKELISILNSRYSEFSDEAKAECDKLVKKVDKYYASVVDELITKVDADDEESIKRAQDAYNQLTDAQKAYVHNLPVLEQAIEDSQRGCRSGFVTILPLLCAAVLLILRKERK